MFLYICENDDYELCFGFWCDLIYYDFDERGVLLKCVRKGCEYNLYRMGVKEFYGKGKLVDIIRKFM